MARDMVRACGAAFAVVAAALPAFGQVGTWDAPVPVAEINTTASDYYPNLSWDGLTLRWSSNRTDIPGSPGGSDFYEAVRPYRLAPFGPVTRMPGGICSSSNDLTIHVMPSETLAFVSNLLVGNYEIHQVARAAPGAPWGGPVLIPELSGSSTDWSPSVTEDGLYMLFASFRTLSWDIYESSRPGPAGPWSAPALVAPLSGANPEFEVCVSPDGLTCYLSQNVGGNRDLFVATRKLRTGPWGTPTLLPVVNGTAMEQAPAISADGRQLFFHSNRAGTIDIHLSRRIGLVHQNLPRAGQPLLLHLSLPALSGMAYQVAVALASSPGIPIPGVGTIPLAVDPLLLLSISGTLPSVFQGFSGLVDAFGEATATFHIPPGPLAGLDFSVAAVTYGPGGINFITNGEDLTINP